MKLFLKQAAWNIEFSVRAVAFLLTWAFFIGITIGWNMFIFTTFTPIGWLISWFLMMAPIWFLYPAIGMGAACFESLGDYPEPAPKSDFVKNLEPFVN